MKHYRITKYNPEKRNNLGHYTLDDWTSYGDIGEVFNGNKLTQDEYLNIESEYLNIISVILESYSSEFFIIKDLSPYFKLEEFRKEPLLNTGKVINSLVNNLEKTNCFDLNIKNISNNIVDESIKEFKYIGPNEFDIEKNIQIQYKDDFIFNIKCLDDIFKLLIRELIPGSKIHLGKSYIYFGYDMYLYLYCKNGIITREVVDKIKQKGVYIEEGIK